MTLSDAFKAKLEALPSSAGCYLFRGKEGEVLYVGKAKSLRSRVKSYFQETHDNRAFIPFLREIATDFETLVTQSEKEAAILENNLIKQHRPRYNVKLRDDKEFLSLRLSSEHDWPRLELVRRPKTDKARYFGPYHSATAARRTLQLVGKHFQLRTCSDRELMSRKRPCLQHQIKRCPAPCVLEVDREVYLGQVKAVALFLEGRHDELSEELQGRMRAASQACEFELAAVYRDQLRAVSSLHETQRVVAVSDVDQDVLGLYREGNLVELSLTLVRSGRVVDMASYSSRNVEIPDDEVVAGFLREQYGEGGGSERFIPQEILVTVLPEGSQGVAEWLGERRAHAGQSGKCELLAPARGPRRALLELAVENARHAFEEKRRAADDIEVRLVRLQQRLRLPTLPYRIECCDISHLGGQDTVGAVVALYQGVPDKARYRTYHVRAATEGDDYRAIYEVLVRRFRRGAVAAGGASTEELGEDKSEWALPDLFIVDGGRGQLQIALTAARDLGLHELSIVGLAKEREQPSGGKIVDRVYLPGQKNPILLRPNSPELFFLAQARDEAHRFSNRGRTKLGKRRRFKSEIDDIKGLGPKARSALLNALGSVAMLKTATDEEILAVPGIDRRHLAKVRSWLQHSEASKDEQPDGS